MGNTKEKAEELFWIFKTVELYNDQAQECAIIAVNLILEEYCNDMSFDPAAHYWIEVKQHLKEIET